ncbi:hypothetical protein [Burkholderia puraquae]|uniref:hypothetical protein n=1 Tax=Burkholderia puraquae TaxID=1904757 RepID=UPI0013FDE4F9
MPHGPLDKNCSISSYGSFRSRSRNAACSASRAGDRMRDVECLGIRADDGNWRGTRVRLHVFFDDFRRRVISGKTLEPAGGAAKHPPSSCFEIRNVKPG